LSDLSQLAETLSDFAISVAKRHGNSQVNSLHLLAAVRRWNEEAFDDRFPELTASISSRLQATRGDALTVEGLEDGVREILAEVQTREDVGPLTDRLVATILGNKPDAIPVPSGSTSLPKEPETADHTFALTASLLDRVATCLSRELVEVASQAVTDAAAAVAQVMGSLPDDFEAKVISELGIAGVRMGQVQAISGLVSEVAAAKDSGAARVATQLALALVDVAEWAAALDQVVTEDETDRIDQVRIALRAQLGKSIDGHSEAIDAFEAKFQGLVGMTSVKAELRKRVDFLIANKRRGKRGLPTAPHRMHLAFVGNPGTGKTTVARLYGELLNDLGLLPKRHFVETDRSGLVGEHVGATEKKTRSVLNSADGGVLFIDEAYALNDRYGQGNKGYGEEATDVLVKFMEDNRDRLVVILAGYRAQTIEYLTVNPGIKSRIPLVVDFPDYTEGELGEIAAQLATRLQLKLAAGALEKIVALLLADRGSDGFGNARAVENVLEAAQRNLISRMSELGNLATEAEMTTIIPEDIPQAVPQREKTIGFQPSSART